MLRSIGHNLKGLARFSGRDARGIFWPYAGALFLLAMTGCGLAIVPTLLEATARMQHFAIEHPESATITQGPGSYSIQLEGRHPELMPDLTGPILDMAIVAGLFVLLAAAAVVRRLHDRGFSGALALPPLLFLATGFALMPGLMDMARADSVQVGGVLLLFANNLLYLASLAGLVALLAQRGSDGPNRYGENPIPPEARLRRQSPPRPRG